MVEEPKKPENENVEKKQTVRTCICPTHGDIGQAILNIQVFNKFNHIYCMICFDEFLQANKIPLVEVAEKIME